MPQFTLEQKAVESQRIARVPTIEDVIATVKETNKKWSLTYDSIGPHRTIATCANLPKNNVRLGIKWVEMKEKKS